MCPTNFLPASSQGRCYIAEATNCESSLLKGTFSKEVVSGKKQALHREFLLVQFSGNKMGKRWSQKLPRVYATRQNYYVRAGRNYTCMLSVQYIFDIFLSERRLCQFPLGKIEKYSVLLGNNSLRVSTIHSSIITSNRILHLSIGQ